MKQSPKQTHSEIMLSPNGLCHFIIFTTWSCFFSFLGLLTQLRICPLVLKPNWMEQVKENADFRLDLFHTILTSSLFRLNDSSNLLTCFLRFPFLQKPIVIAQNIATECLGQVWCSRAQVQIPAIPLNCKCDVKLTSFPSAESICKIK